MSTTVTCSHSPSTDPRGGTACVKCGRECAEYWRKPTAEHALIKRCSDNDDTANHLIAYLNERAGTEHWRDLAHRDFRRETYEELVDGAAYLCGMAQQRRVLGYEDELSSGQLMALQHIIKAYECLARDTGD